MKQEEEREKSVKEDERVEEARGEVFDDILISGSPTIASPEGDGIK